MDAKLIFRGMLSAVWHLLVLAVSLGLLTIGIQLTFGGHWIVGPALLISGLAGCRLTAGALNRWSHSRNDTKIESS